MADLIPVVKAARLRRRELEWSQEKLAQQSGVDRTVIVRYERGETEPSLTTLLKVLMAMGMELKVEVVQ